MRFLEAILAYWRRMPTTTLGISTGQKSDQRVVSILLASLFSPSLALSLIVGRCPRCSHSRAPVVTHAKPITNRRTPVMIPPGVCLSEGSDIRYGIGALGRKGYPPLTLSFRIDRGSLSYVVGNKGTKQNVIGETRVMPSVTATGRFGDQTGDSRADIYAVTSDGQLSLYRSGSDAVSMVANFGKQVEGATAMVKIGNVGADRRSDVLVRRADNSLWICASTPAGGLRPWRKVGNGWGGMDRIVFAGKLSGTSAQYVVASEKSTGDLYRYRLTDSGLTGKTRIGQGWGSMRFFFSAGDVNGDGRSDIIGVRASDGTMWLYAGRANGTVASGQKIGQGWGGYRVVFSPGDISGDGRFDQVAVDATGTLYGYRNNGRGGWSTRVKLGTGFKAFKLLA